MNKIKIIRRVVTKARNSSRKASLDMLRLTGVKRRHAYYYSYQKNMDQQKYYKMTMTKTLPRDVDVVETMREQVLAGEPIMLNNVKRRYEKPKIVIHETEIVPSQRCKLCL